MWLQEHEERCIEFFGKPFTEVHRFLDGFAREVGKENHRQYLHNPAGVEEAVAKFGEGVRCAALLHLYDDFEYFQYWDAFGNLRHTVKDVFYEEFVLR